MSNKENLKKLQVFTKDGSYNIQDALELAPINYAIGRDLMSLLNINNVAGVMDAIHDMCQNPTTATYNGMTFSNLLPGDYIQLDASVGSQVSRNSSLNQSISSTAADWVIEIVEIDGYAHSYQSPGHHVVWQFKNCPLTSYVGSTMTKFQETGLGIWLNGTFKNTLISLLGGSSHAHLFAPWRYQLTYWDGNTFKFADDQSSQVFLPTDEEVIGYAVWSRNISQNTHKSSKLWSLYANTKRPFSKTKGGGNMVWWLGSASSHDSATWCYVDRGGYVDYHGVASNALGVPPAFCTN